MKYLKTFEDNEYKRYILLKIVDNENYFFVICEIVEFLNDVTYRCNVNKLYKMDKDGFRKINQDSIKISDGFLKRTIVKQSDNLEDLINIIEPMFHSGKFNI